MHRVDPEAHLEDSPRAVQLASLNGRVETFAALAAHLHIDPNDEWFQLAQVCGILVYWNISHNRTVVGLGDVGG